MLTFKRFFKAMRRARIRVECKVAIAKANRIKARTLRRPNPGYDELANPGFIGLMILGTLVLCVDYTDGWGQPGMAVSLVAGVVLVTALAAFFWKRGG